MPDFFREDRKHLKCPECNGELMYTRTVHFLADGKKIPVEEKTICDNCGKVVKTERIK